MAKGGLAMALPALVLVHGSSLAADSWDLTVDEIHRQAPELTVRAVDLPGRRGKSGDLGSARVDEWVDSVMADIEDTGVGELVIVGHSTAGLIVPGVVTKLGSARVREMILAAAFVPPHGTALVDTFPGLLGWYARRESISKARKGKAATMPSAWAMFTFCNGMTRAQRSFVRERLYPDSPTVVLESVDRSAMPDCVPRTWVLTCRDRAISVKAQCKCISALGGVQSVVPIDTCHMLMVSEPQHVAGILVERCRRYA